MKNIVLYLSLINCVFSYIKAQPVLQPSGDGFWTQVNTMRMEQIIWRNDTLFAARTPMYQSNGGVYRSVDGGLNWDTLYSTSETISGGLRLFLHPTESRTMYLIFGALYKSTNAGQSWNLILGANGPLVRLAINPQNPQIMYATKSVPFGTVYKTTNGGSDWSISGNGLLQEVYFAAGPIDVNPENPNIILLGTNAGLYRSTNSGESWDTTAIKGFIPGVNIHPLLPSIAFTSTTYDWTTYKTIDFGVSWDSIVGSRTVNKFIFHNTEAKIIYNTSNLKSIDTGKTWFSLDSIYNSWADLENNDQENNVLFGINSTYGLYTFNDLLVNINEEVKNSNRLNILAYPNPFNTTTTIRFTIPEQKEISIQVFDIMGRLVKTVLPGSLLNAGQYNYTWDGKDDNGIPVSSGIYFSNMFIKGNNLNEVRSLKMILLK